MLNGTKTATHEGVRWIIAWTLIILIITVIVTTVLYNINAVMMIFGKGEINLQSYDGLVKTIQSQPFDYVEINHFESSHGESTIYYRTYDSIGIFSVSAVDNQILTIDAWVNMPQFNAFSFFDKYGSIDQMLRPICKDSDVLAAEVAIVKLSSRLAITSITSTNQIEDNTNGKQVTISQESGSDYLVIHVEQEE